MDRFRQLDAFVAVAEHGGFSAAAKHLNLSPPSVTRLIAALEARLDARLFVRTTRHVSLTETGRRLFADATRVLADLDTIEGVAAGAKSVPQGVLRVTAPVEFGHRFIAPILRDFIDAHPKVSARAVFNDHVVNIYEEGLDVAVRIGQLPDSSLRSLRVGAVRSMIVAAPEYLAKHNAPNHPKDLAEHRILVSTDAETPVTWSFFTEAQRYAVTVRPAFMSNTINATLDGALAGWGITRALSYQVFDAVERGTLVELLPGFDDRRLPVHLLYPEDRAQAAKNRAFIDFAADALRANAARFEVQQTGDAERDGEGTQ